MRETCTSGSVRGEGGNILTYSAIVCPAPAGRLFVLARLGRLQQGETKFALRSCNLLSLRRQRWHPPIGRMPISDVRVPARLKDTNTLL
jgi:hypothetical protein